MKTINYNGRVGRAVLAFSLMFGIGIMMSLTAQAQGNGEWHRRDEMRARREAMRQRQAQIIAERRAQRQAQRNNGTYNNGTYNNGTYNNGTYNNGTYNNGNQALNQGYQAGINVGASDAQRRQSYSPQRSSHYRNASSQAFRDGFVRGYDAGFRQYAANNGGYNNGTYNNGGYNNGGYNNDGTYNNGGYNNGGYNNQNQVELNQGYQQGVSTGSSDAQRRQSYSPQRSRHYQEARSQAFRDGFVRGYDAGFRQYAGNNGGYDNNGGYNRTGQTGVGIGDILGVILGRP